MPFTKPQLRQAPSLIANLLLPFLCFKLLTHFGFSDANALAITAVFPGLKVAFDGIKSRRIDVLGCVVLWEIALTLTLNACFHNARLLLLKGPIQVGALGLACFGSLAVRMPLAQIVTQILDRPALHIGGQDTGTLRSATASQLRTVTLVWGVASVADAVVRTMLIYSLRTDVYILVSRIMQWIYFGSLLVWSVAYLKRPDSGLSAAKAQQDASES